MFDFLLLISILKEEKKQHWLDYIKQSIKWQKKKLLNKITVHFFFIEIK